MCGYGVLRLLPRTFMQMGKAKRKHDEQIRGQMKSVTVYNNRGQILLKVIHRKNGDYAMEGINIHKNIYNIDVRDDKNQKVAFI